MTTTTTQQPEEHHSAAPCAEAGIGQAQHQAARSADLTRKETRMSDQWETFCDVGYYHMWRLRRKTERGWNDGFHINTKAEAEALCELLNKLEGEVDEAWKYNKIATEAALKLEDQRNEAREQRDRLAEALREIAQGSSCLECGGGNAVWLAEQALAAVKGGNNERR
jgi:hypothetical protein